MPSHSPELLDITVPFGLDEETYECLARHIRHVAKAIVNEALDIQQEMTPAGCPVCQFDRHRKGLPALPPPESPPLNRTMIDEAARRVLGRGHQEYNGSHEE